MRIMKYYPYRVARVYGNETSVPRNVTRILEMKLFEAIDVNSDNHVCFEIEDENFNTRYIWFHDHITRFGDQIEVNEYPEYIQEFGEFGIVVD